jgi:hypothetical protein
VIRQLPDISVRLTRCIRSHGRQYNQKPRINSSLNPCA